MTNTKNHKCNILCTNIESKTDIKYLGITIDQRLKWSPHINILNNRIRKLTYIFRCLRDILNEKLLRTTYFAFCQSIIQYGIIGWGGTYKNQTQTIYISQKLIIKTILKKPYSYSSELLFKQFKVRKLSALYFYHATLQIYKDSVQNKTAPFKNNRNLRQTSILPTPKCKKTIGQLNHKYLGIIFFNSLPEKIRNTNSNIKEFKTQLKNYTENLN